MSQLVLMIAVSLLVGLASAGLIWFGTDLVNKLRGMLIVWWRERQARAAEAAEAAEEADEQ